MSAILDASVLYNMALDRPSDERMAAAREIRPHLAAHYGIAAPTLVAWELGNVLHVKYGKATRLTPTKRSDLLEGLLHGLDLREPNPQALRKTAELAARWKLTLYDAAYLELASRDDVSFLVTEDRPLLASAERALGSGRAYDALGIKAAIAANEL